MSGLFKSPKAPDPYKTAQAQSHFNIQTAQEQARLASEAAQEQARLGMTGQQTPYGSLSYVADPNSPSGFRAVTAFSPEQQQLYDQFTGNQLQLGGMASRQMDSVSDILSSPIDLSNEAVEARLMELGRLRLDPVWSDLASSLETDLINRGIRPGSDAYAAMHRTFDTGRNDAYNNLLLAGRGQAVNEALIERNQPLQELAMLLGASGATMPTFGATPQPGVSAPGVAPVDFTGLVMNNFNQKVAGQNAMMGGLSGLAGTALGGWAMGGFPGLPVGSAGGVAGKMGTTGR